MVARTSLFVAAGAVIGAAVVSGQATPDWTLFPKACASACSDTIETSYLCQNQYAGYYAAIYGCYCNAFPSDNSACASCLNTNSAGALAKLVSGTATDCPTAIKSCRAECAITPCDKSDIACQCSPGYLQDIHDCAQCNTNNKNTGVTLMSDWTALRDSCADQKYPGADAAFGMRPSTSPTGQAAYKAPALTATGGGVAATGDVSVLAQTGPANTSRRPVVTGTAAGPNAAVYTPGAAAASASAGTTGAASAGSGSAASAKAGSSAGTTAAGAGAGTTAGTTAAAATGSNAPLVVVTRPGSGALALSPSIGLVALFGAAAALL